MPTAPMRPCGHVGCRELVQRGYCPAHERPRAGWQDAEARRLHDRQRGSAAARGYDAAWTRLRRRVIREEPLCRACRDEGRVTRAEMVDHIVPVRQAPERRLDRANLQPLCRPCHHRKTLEDGSYAR